MPNAKQRGSRKPERASTRPPAKPRSSFPQHDPRPAPAPRGRGKSGTAFASGERARREHASAKPAPEAAKPRPRPKAAKPPKDPASMDAPVMRKLTDARRTELAGIMAQRVLERRAGKLDVRRLRGELKVAKGRLEDLEAESEGLAEQVSTGLENAVQGDLFAHEQGGGEDAELEAGSGTPAPGEADQALAEIAKHVPALDAMRRELGNGGTDEHTEA